MRSRARDQLKRVLLTLSIPIVTASSAAWAQEPTAEEMAGLRALIQEMKEAHAAQVESLERRIEELEAARSEAPVPGPVPGELAKEAPTPLEVQKLEARIEELEARRYGLRTAPEAAERDPVGEERDERFLERLVEFKQYDVTRGFKFGGYFRSGYGTDKDGDILEAFQAPNADSKFRLGNEEETYIETIFAYTFPELDLEEDQEFYVQFRPSYNIPDANESDTSFSMREAWAAARGVWDGNPTAAFWAGQRFYDRFDVHMTDFYYLDMSGFGGGVEDIQVGEWGKFALAWFGGTIDSFESNGSGESDTTNGKNSIDLRFYDFPLPYGKGFAWINFAWAKDFLRPNNVNVDVDGGAGAAFALAHEQEMWGGRNRWMVQYGFGPASNFRSSQEDFSELDPPDDGPPLQIRSNDAWHFRVVNDLVINPSERWSFAGTFVYDLIDFGEVGENSRREWISVGVRPIYHITDFFSLQLEAGIDHTDKDRDLSGELYKITFSPQITPGRRWFDRPAIRLFATYAHWSGSFRGIIAPRTYGNERNGLTMGVQAEAWW